MRKDRFDKLLAFIRRLEDAKIWFRLSRNRFDAISVEIVAPGERWEVDFAEDGSIDVERFRSDGSITDATALDDLFALCTDDLNAVALVGGNGKAPAKSAKTHPQAVVSK